MLTKTAIPLGLVMIVFLLMAGWWGLAASSGEAFAQPPEPSREVQGPAISFIDGPNATCYQPVPRSDTCYINWSTLSVSATSPQYVVSMTVSIDNRLRAVHWGFFQTSLSLDSELYGEGFRVSCGSPGASGLPGFGRAYNYTVRAAETGGLQAANYGSVVCPAGPYGRFLPLISR